MSESDSEGLVKGGKNICIKFVRHVGNKIKENEWYTLLLIVGILYIYLNIAYIGGLENLTACNLVFLLWLLLLAYPLISEMNLLGIKIKKEVEKEVEKETKAQRERLTFLQQQISVLQSNNNVINNQFSVYQAPNLSEQDIDEYNKKNAEYAANQTDPQFYVKDNNVDMFKYRLSVENNLKDLCLKLGYPYRMTVHQMVNLLIRLEAISTSTGDLIHQLQKFASFGVHGEPLSDKYIEFVKKSYSEIMQKLDEVSKNLHYTVCPKCRYQGYAVYDNVCPKCGTHHDDD